MLQRELDAAVASARHDIDATPLGSYVKDDHLIPLVYNALLAAEKVRRARDAEMHAPVPAPAPPLNLPPHQ